MKYHLEIYSDLTLKKFEECHPFWYDTIDDQFVFDSEKNQAKSISQSDRSLTYKPVAHKNFLNTFLYEIQKKSLIAGNVDIYEWLTDELKLKNNINEYDVAKFLREGNLRAVEYCLDKGYVMIEKLMKYLIIDGSRYELLVLIYHFTSDLNPDPNSDLNFCLGFDLNSVIQYIYVSNVYATNVYRQPISNQYTTNSYDFSKKWRECNVSIDVGGVIDYLFRIGVRKWRLTYETLEETISIVINNLKINYRLVSCLFGKINKNSRSTVQVDNYGFLHHSVRFLSSQMVQLALDHGFGMNDTERLSNPQPILHSYRKIYREF